MPQVLDPQTWKGPLFPMSNLPTPLMHLSDGIPVELSEAQERLYIPGPDHDTTLQAAYLFQASSQANKQRAKLARLG
jgi:hypothetical protein